MSNPDDPHFLRRRASRDRIRDFFVLGAATAGIFVILSLSGALGFVEAITALFVIWAAGLAYYVGTTEPPKQSRGQVEASQDLVAPTSLKSVLDACPIPAMHIDGEGRLQAVNDLARILLRLPAGRLVFAAAALRSPDLLTAVETALSGGRPDPVETSLGPGGNESWCAEVAPLPAPFGGALLTLQDQTVVRRAERARADFLANASHELRTPLTSLLGYIETMQGPAKDDKDSWDRFLVTMREQGERMKRLIADLLSLSRIELNEHQRPDAVIDFNHIVRSASQAIEPVARERGVAIVLPPEGGPLSVVALADEITQVVQNLVDNAVKYSPDGGAVTVEVGAAATLAETRQKAARQWDDASRMTVFAAPGGEADPGVYVRISDQGPGIEARHLPRLGERFYRADESRGGEITGTGLGLAIVKHIIARHRGGFAVETRLGRGSAFAVWLPAASVDALSYAR
ncbi:MAG: ATP-binding protein [Pseudomonadota bacterium]